MRSEKEIEKRVNQYTSKEGEFHCLYCLGCFKALKWVLGEDKVEKNEEV